MSGVNKLFFYCHFEQAGAGTWLHRFGDLAVFPPGSELISEDARASELGGRCIGELERPIAIVLWLRQQPELGWW